MPAGLVSLVYHAKVINVQSISLNVTVAYTLEVTHVYCVYIVEILYHVTL